MKEKVEDNRNSFLRPFLITRNFFSETNFEILRGVKTAQFRLDLNVGRKQDYR